MMKGIMKIKEDLSHRRGWITSSVISIILFFTSYESQSQKQITSIEICFVYSFISSVQF